MPVITSKYRGVVYSLFATILSVVTVWMFSAHDIMSQKIPMITVQYGLWITVWSLFVWSMTPAYDFWSHEKKRSFFYYCCCLMTSLSATLLTAHIHKAYAKIKAKLLTGNEIYLKTPQGISSEVFHSMAMRHYIGAVQLLQMN